MSSISDSKSINAFFFQIKMPLGYKDKLYNSRSTSNNSVFDDKIQAIKTHFWVDAYIVSSKLRYVKRTEKTISGEEMYDICKNRAIRYLGLFVEPTSDSSSSSSSERMEEEKELEKRFQKRIQQIREGGETPGLKGDNSEGYDKQRDNPQQERGSTQKKELLRTNKDVYGGLDKLEILGTIFKDIKRDQSLADKITPPLSSSFSFSTSPFSSYPVEKLMELQSVKQMKKISQNSHSDVTFRVKVEKQAPRSLYGPLMEGEEEVAEQSEYDTIKKRGAMEIEREWEVEGYKWGDDYDERDRDSERDRAVRREEERDRNDEKILFDKMNTIEDFDLFGNSSKLAATYQSNYGSQNLSVPIARNQNSHTNSVIRNDDNSNNSDSETKIHIKTALKSLLIQLSDNCYCDENKTLIMQHLSFYLKSEREAIDYDEGDLIHINSY